ncbi:SNF1-interacting protein [Ascosphaera aggregata]|nr:SNF1-interacting protein [Ascosphaera aggregata]
MGNANTKEARVVIDAQGRPVVQNSSSLSSSLPSSGFAHHHGSSSSRRSYPHSSSASSRHLRPDRGEMSSSLGIAGERESAPVAPRKETRQDREARKQEREQALRLEERERSIREEHVDGGYLVALGVYIGHEDWNKKVVRRLIIERRLAPYWRGLNDIDESWTDHQLIAAARGLEIPPADAIPPELDIKQWQDTDAAPTQSSSPYPPSSSSPAIPICIQSPAESRSNPGFANVQSDSSAPFSSSGPNPSPLQTATSRLQRARAKTMTALMSKPALNIDNDDPPELSLPRNPFVTNEPLEVHLYKNATECPICFLYYPPYLNQTRCCQQPICTECFVKIKRPDPHLPEHHPGEDSNTSNSESNDSLSANRNNHEGSAAEEQLISEPALCPYCTRPEFGVTYQPPPFKRGLTYAPPVSLQQAKTLEATASSTNLTRRPRSHSLPACAPNVITTDMIRPDWVQKLQNARDHAARRAAAATALHTAAYHSGIHGNIRLTSRRGSDSSRHLPSLTRRHVLRRATGHLIGGHGTDNGEGVSSLTRQYATATSQNYAATVDNSGAAASTTTLNQEGGGRLGDRSSTDNASGSIRSGTGMPSQSDLRQTRLNRAEEIMMSEAIRQSIISEEERQRKEAKGARKEAKKQQKELKKADKQARKNSAGSSHG